MTSPPGPGFTLTRQTPANAVVTADLDRPLSDVWPALADVDAFQRALVDAVLAAADGRTVDEFLDELKIAEIDTADANLPAVLVRMARGDERAYYQYLKHITDDIARGRSPFDDIYALVRVFALAEDVAPTVAVRVPRAFTDLRADQRRDICRFLAELARGCDVRVVATGFMQRWLAATHRENLPGVSDALITPPGVGPPTDEVIDAARDALDPDSREVAVLRDLADDPTGTLSYTALTSMHAVSRSRIRQVIGRLGDLELVATFDGGAGRTVELLPAGRDLVETIDSETGRPTTISDALAERRQSAPQSPVSLERTRGPPTADAPDAAAGAGAYFVEYMKRSEAIAAASAAVEDGVSLVDHPIAGRENPKEPWIDYDPDADRIVTSVQATTPYGTVIRVARALASPAVFQQVLTPDRLDDILATVGRDLLRHARQTGWLPDDAKDGKAFAEELKTAREDLVDLTRAVRNDDVDDRDRARSTVMREARGLAGTVAQLLDLAGVETVVEYRLPEFSRHYDAEDRAELAETIVGLLTVCSRYGHYSGHRLLFEERPEKRQAAGSPDVDAADPFGDLLLDTVIVADGVEGFRPHLIEEIEALTPHDDAPEVQIPVPVTTPGRDAYEQSVREVLRSKNMDPRPEVVDILEAYTGSVYDVTAAVTRALDGEDLRRTVRLSEARRALAMLPADRLLPDAPPTMGKILAALLRADEPLTQAALAEAADVSVRSIQRHGDRLTAFDLVRIDAEGYRMALPFNTDAERYDDVHPWYATPNTERADHRDATVAGVVWEAVEHLDEPPDPGSDVDDPIYRAATGDLKALRRAWPWIGPYLDAVGVIAAHELRENDAETVTFGAELEQTSIEAATAEVTRTG